MTWVKAVTMDSEAELGLEKIVHPKVVVAADIVDLDAALPEFMKHKEHLLVLFGDSVLVLKPEIEQITQYNQAVAIGFHFLKQKANVFNLLIFFFL